MGSPGVFIHSGTLGGRLSALSPAASASLPAMTSPPTTAPPPRRNRRRDVGAGSFLRFVGLTMVRFQSIEQGGARRGLPLLCRSCCLVRHAERRAKHRYVLSKP